MPAVTVHGPAIATATPATECRQHRACLSARAGRRWARCGLELHHGTHWPWSTRHGSTGNSGEPNLLIKSKRKPVLKITHQIKE